MSGLPQASEEKGINGVDVREHGNALRVATNTPHLVSLGTGRLSTAVTLHPIRQGRITIGTDLNSDIRLQGTGVNPEHCRVENSHGVVTLYPVNGITLIDGTIVDRPTRLSQGCMLTIGRSNYLRFNHPEEAKLMKSVLPNPHISMSPIQFHPDEDVATFEENHHYQPHRRADTLSELDRELDKTLKEMNRRKPPVAPRKTYKELDQMSNSSSSDQDSGSYISTQRSKTNSIMAKVSKFEYYAKSQQKNGRISNDNGVFSPKVFSANSMTVNTPAKDVLGGKTTPSHVPQNNSRIFINENNAVDARSCSYANVTVRSQANMIDRMAKNFENAANATNQRPFEARPTAKIQQPSPSFDRNPNFNGMDRGPTEKPSQRAQQARLHEEQEKDTENERLEEILHMCAEYEKQISSGIPITPTEKKPHNKIITNGSLPRSIQNSPNIVQTSEGYFIFDTGSPARLACSPFHSTPNPKPPSSYENVGFPIDTRQRTATGYENVIIENAPQRHFPITELSSPVMIRKISRNAQNSSTYTPVSPIGSPYDNLRLLSGKTESNSPRTRIKTTFAHKTPSSPQYFIFPSPPPIEELYEESDTVQKRDLSKCTGIEKQLSITEEIPMIDDSELTNDVEQRSNEQRSSDQRSILRTSPDLIPNGRTNKFEEIRQYLMADIPELEEIGKNIEKNLKPNNVEIVQAEINLTAPTFTEKEEDSLERERRARFEDLKERRKKVLSEIYELKSALSEIRTQEDDILRELEMEKALLKGEYDSEIAILNIEQQKKSELIEKARKFESKMRESKQKQDRQQGEMRDRVDLASLKYDRVEKDFGENRATSDELRNAQEVLENERKLFEDTEFQHLEEEAEWLAYREDLQNDIIALTQKIESQKSRILTLKSEATSNLKLALEESKGLQGESVKILNKIEELTNRLRTTDDLIRETGLAWMMERPLSPEYGKIVSSNLTYRNSKPLIGSVVLDSPPSSDDGEDLFASLDSSEGTRCKNFKEKFLSIDQMSRSMIVDLGEKRNIDDLIDPETSSPESIEKPSSPETKEKKPGFWERNFDSLSRLKKDKKNKPKPDVMSQSLNENLFFNNDNIESEIGCFEKTKHKTTHSKIPTLTALGKMIRKDSITKKGKDGSVEPAIANKENIDSNSSIEVSPNPESKTRYIKNQKATHSENRYLNRSGKSPEKSHQNSSSEENRLSLTDSLEGDCDPLRKSDAFNRVMSESQRVPSQEDIDRMSKVTLDSPLVSKDGDMDSLGRKTLDSLMEIEKRRMELLELKGCQVIENEREKISELKKRVQNEAKLLWESRLSQPKEVEELEISEEQVTGTTDTSADNETRKEGQEISNADSSSVKEVGLENESCSVFDDSTIGDSASIEKHRHSQTDSYNSSALIDDDPRSSSRNRLTTGNGSLGRPLSEVSDMSDNSTVPNFPIIQGSRDIPMRQRKNLNSSAYCPRTDLQRPLTRYLPIDNDQLNLRSHIETAGHQVEMCPHVSIDMTSCRGYLHKLGAKFHTWSKRWFVFDRTTKTLIYYSDKSEKKPRGGAYFQVIEEVYLDHLNMSKSPNPRTTFVLKTKQRKYYLMAPSGEAARIWIDVIFTGAQGYTEYQ